MNPLSAIFGAGVALRNALYDRGVFKVRKLSRPVVSVGNISVGGSGKTPFVIALGQLLQERGIALDVLSRGYGRNSAETAVVDPNGSPAQFGDEPLLIAHKLQVPVIVGPDRYQAGLLAEKNFNVKLHLLDDAFQHRQLHRDFDIVMAPVSDLEGTLLPFGRLREPVSALRRADAIVSDHGERQERETPPAREGGEDALQAVEQLMKLTVERVMQLRQARAGSLQVVPVEIWHMKRNVYLEQATRRPLVFCGIARPRQFMDYLRELGIEPADSVAFPDHHRYSEGDVSRLLRVKASVEADGFVTTEKDAINLGALAAGLQPLHIARLRIMLEKPDEAMSTLLSTLEQRCSCRF